MTSKVGRRITAVAVSESTDPDHGPNRSLFALCEDGTLWALVPAQPNSEERWERVLPIPEEDA